MTRSMSDPFDTDAAQSPLPRYPMPAGGRMHLNNLRMLAAERLGCAHEISPRRQAFDRFVTGFLDGAADWLQHNWLLVVNVILGAFVGVALLVPVLFAFGFTTLAAHLFAAYHLFCAQIPSHSYYLLGYQLALCARNLAIYSSLFVGSVVFRWVRTRLSPLDVRVWMLTLVPMALDGGTQLFGWRESTWELRTLTGVILGLGVCWFVLPRLEDAARAMPSLGAPLLA